jgi:phosphoribosylaminoimidazole carboxylase PurE protein
MTLPRVAIVLGSESDRATMDDAVKVLAEFGVEHEVVVASAHRAPELVDRYVRTAEDRGIRVFIAAAGGAAHLAGAVAARTVLPVIGVPLAATPLNGMDALLSIVQMPKGVPVATVAIGSWGATNAALLAAQILALGDPALAERLTAYRKRLAAEVDERARRVADKLRARSSAG